MGQTRKITTKTRAGQYMCPECGKVFGDKKSVDSHIFRNHEPSMNDVWKLA
ncbi:MAG: hypothetical protein ABSF44_05530 [Candidatus Bathyarchaeia archaeon]